jgi:hypothetical protein
MNNLNSLQEIARAIRNLIRTGIVTDVDPVKGLCRVQTGGIQTTWLNWLTARAGRSRSLDNQLIFWYRCNTAQHKTL